MIKFLNPKKIIILLLCVGAHHPLDAFSYECVCKDNCSFHVLVVNPKEHRIIPVRAAGEEVSRETVATLAKRYGARAAINGGFWHLNGMPAGALKINHQWFGTPTKPRGAIGWSVINPKVLIDRILTTSSLSDCSSESEIQVIPLSPCATPQDWNQMEHIVGGSPMLIQNGKVIKDFTPEKTSEAFLFNQYSRTGVGIRANGDWVFVVVDSGFLDLGGMTIKELADLMLSFGCVQALNLDGGGSSTMVIQGIVVNEPCGKMEEDGKNIEAVSDAILIF